MLRIPLTEHAIRRAQTARNNAKSPRVHNGGQKLVGWKASFGTKKRPDESMVKCGRFPCIQLTLKPERNASRDFFRYLRKVGGIHEFIIEKNESGSVRVVDVSSPDVSKIEAIMDAPFVLRWDVRASIRVGGIASGGGAELSGSKRRNVMMGETTFSHHEATKNVSAIVPIPEREEVSSDGETVNDVQMRPEHPADRAWQLLLRYEGAVEMAKSPLVVNRADMSALMEMWGMLAEMASVPQTDDELAGLERASAECQEQFAQIFDLASQEARAK